MQHSTTQLSLRTLFWLPLVIFLALGPAGVWAQPGSNPSPDDLKKLTVEELLDLEVLSVSKSPEKLSEVASAIQVVTNEDIRRSGAMRLPDALRLAPNLQVGQTNSHDWAITARGFNGAPLSNNTLADKLLVMIDGRSVYTPLFGGVFWDVQNVLLEDIQRIEVVSGPGGTLWGANAVNGVINILSKSARETQGLYVSGAAGSFLQDYGGLRYGWQMGKQVFLRVYGQRLDQRSTTLRDSSSVDAWNMTQGGFRMDYLPSHQNTFTLQGDLYGGREGVPTSTNVDGQNVLGRWTHVFSEQSDLSLQVYFDRTWRSLPEADFNDQLETFDVDFQHHFSIGTRQKVLWGAGYRTMRDEVHNSPSLSFRPGDRTLQLFNGFFQDQIALIPQRLELTLGSKLLHNDYSGYELQPSVRLAWMPSSEHTLWAAVSRAVRTPSRFDADEVSPFLITIDQVFHSEKVVAYELGYRVRPFENLSLSLAGFYNKYDDLRSINRNENPPPDFVFANDQRARSWGFEISGNAVITNWWRLRGGYTFLDKKFSAKSALVVPGSDLFEGIDPNNQVLLQSVIDLPKNFQFDLVGRYVDLLPASSLTPVVPAYVAFDVRLAWQFKGFTFALVGQNLADRYHPEFGSREIPASIYQKITFRW